MATGLLHFDGVPEPISIADCAWLLACLPRVFKTWQFRFEAAKPRPATAISITREAGDYVMVSPYLDEPAVCADPIDMACALVVDLVAAYLDANQHLLCLHGAGVEIAGGLVVFPNEYRAGKSTLSACLAARGLRIIGDDILPMQHDPKTGQLISVATGVAPRLRLPLPHDFSKTAVAFTEENRGPASKHYLYLDLDESRHAVRGAQVPVHAIILLERDRDHELALQPASQADALRSLLWQNFARYRRSSEILDMLHDLVTRIPAFKLRYSRAEDAAALLENDLATAIAVWAKNREAATADHPGNGANPLDGAKTIARALDPAQASPELESDDHETDIAAQAHEAGQLSSSLPRFVRVDGFSERIVDGERFLAAPDGSSIHHLNETGSAIWQLLAEPISKAEIVELFAEVFPDTPRSVLLRDTGKLLAILRRKGGVHRLATAPDPVKGRNASRRAR